MKCGTCKREVPEVSRVVIYTEYNKANTKPLHNCPDCYAKKEQGKPYAKDETTSEEGA